MRYHPNHDSGFFVRIVIKNRIAKSPTTNETAVPIAMSCHSDDVRTGVFLSSMTDAPKMVGMARRKENETITERGIPSSVPPISVDPARETPGMNEKICAIPIRSACR